MGSHRGWFRFSTADCGSLSANVSRRDGSGWVGWSLNPHPRKPRVGHPAANVGGHDGSIWVGWSLNPHPLKAEGAAPNGVRSVDEFRLGFAFGGYTPVVFVGVGKAIGMNGLRGGGK